MSTALPLARSEPHRLDGSDAFDRRVMDLSGKTLTPQSIDTVQVNICLGCNLACHHCHVESSPKRKETMSWETMRMVLDSARRSRASTLDITGGAPEMHPQFQTFVDAARGQDLHVMVRTNLTILLQPAYAHLVEYLADRHIHLIASLPCYLEENVDHQRGRRVYRESIEVIRRLNAVGYGRDPKLVLDLVYNPGEPALPAAQSELEDVYRRELGERFGIRFNRLYTLTNMPIGRFLHDLRREGRAEEYADLLRRAFNPATVEGLMCRHQLHVGWDGTLYDCDFNYPLGLQVEGTPPHISGFDPGTFVQRGIRTGDHCFGCTAGCGSSCTGALA